MVGGEKKKKKKNLISKAEVGSGFACHKRRGLTRAESD